MTTSPGAAPDSNERRQRVRVYDLTVAEPVPVSPGATSFVVVEPKFYGGRPTDAVPGQRERVASNFDTLVGQLMPTLAEMDPVPYAIVQQARRRAALRSELLATGAFTYRALSEGRGMNPATVRQWVRRARDRYEVFTVEHDNETLLPALLLDADLLPRPEFKAVVEVLTEAGEDSWGLWAWLVHPTPWLDGAIPAVLLFEEPDVVLDVARRRASNAS